jgi:hypothetical protein
MARQPERMIWLRTQPGGLMHLIYYVLAAIAVIVIVGALSMLPDFVRYMKIRSM